MQTLFENLKRNWKFMAIAIGTIILLAVASHADAVTLDYGQCQDYLTLENESITVCAPAFPVINQTVNLTCPESYVNPPYLLTVNALQNNCTWVENITVLNVTNVTYIYNVTNVTIVNVTNVTTESCQMLNKTINLTFSQLYYDDARNLTVKCQDANTCTDLSSYEVTVGYNTTQTWEYVRSITVHGPQANCTSANVSISRPMGYGEYFKVNEPGCFVELFSPPLFNTSCPSIPACPTCPACPGFSDSMCPKMVCPNNTIVKQSVVNNCPMPNPNTNCSVSIKVGDKMYCQDSLEAWSAYQVNATIGQTMIELKNAQDSNALLQGENAYMRGYGDIILAVILLLGLCTFAVLAHAIVKKLGRGGGPIPESKPMFTPIINTQKPIQVEKSEENPPIAKKKPVMAKKR